MGVLFEMKRGYPVQLCATLLITLLESRGTGARQGLTRFAFFLSSLMGSRLRDKKFEPRRKGTDTECSDLDILIDPTQDTTLFDIGAIQYKLHALLGMQVDVLTPAALPEFFRALVIAEAVTV